MDVREKLVEIVKKAAYSSLPSNTEDFHLNMFVTNLLAHGVTVQEWISVKDRLPEKDGTYLVTTNSFGNRQSVKLRWFAKDGENVDAYDLAGQKDVWYLYDIECGYVSIKTVTHWMPLPEMPKVELLWLNT